MPAPVAAVPPYNVLATGFTGDVENLYNPGAALQPYVTTPYLPAFAVAPFSKVPFGVYVSARVLKLIADIARDEIVASMVAARNSSAGSRSSTSTPHVSSCHLALASPA
jgi:hypothetical protein